MKYLFIILAFTLVGCLGKPNIPVLKELINKSCTAGYVRALSDEYGGETKMTSKQSKAMHKSCQDLVDGLKNMD